MFVSVEGNADDDARNLENLLGALSAIHGAQPNQKWKIKCSTCTYLGPWAAAVLYADVLKGRELHQQPKVQLPNSPPALKAYCVFSGMAHAFSGGPPPDSDHPESETIPLTRFVKASWNLPDGIIKLLRRHTEVEDETEDRIRTCVQEVTQNVVDHSGSTTGGVMSARYMARTHEVRVGIVDRGVGIAATLRVRHPDTTGSFMALRRVIQGGYSSLARPNNMGLGVSNLFSLVRLMRGRMAVFTGDAVAEVHGSSDPRVSGTAFTFPGTAVFFALPLVPLEG